MPPRPHVSGNRFPVLCQKARLPQHGLQGDDAEKSEMQGSPPEHADKLPAAPRSQWYRDETKYVERNHDDMKPEDRLSYIDGERCVHFVAGSLSRLAPRR